MPIKPSAHKALRQSKKRAARNKKVKAEINIALRQARRSLTEPKTAADQIKQAIKALDKAAQKKVIKANTAARRKSRLMKALHKAKQS